MSLHELLIASAIRNPNGIAIEESGPGKITYQELDRLSDAARDGLRQLGVGPDHRVGVYLPKSIDALAAIFGILKTGAAYVPVDPNAPASRNAYILNNCSVTAVFIELEFSEAFQNETAKIGTVPQLIRISGTGAGEQLSAALSEMEVMPGDTHRPSPDGLAYILYTSGSTGRPKGVALSHANALAFVDWGSSVFVPRADDRFSSHAPMHFDLSIFDIFVAVKHGATVVLVADHIGKDPARLAELISEKRISIWYSAPSILGLLAQLGDLTRHDFPALRHVLFAGEVFPVKHLKLLKKLLPGPRYFNLYGPTETNVCTFFEIPQSIADDRIDPFPIGKACAHVSTRVVDVLGHDVAKGTEGELCVAGAPVMKAYWNLPEQTSAAFLDSEDGERWYKTGDIVVEGNDGNFVYLGRRDRMVKRRGYRVELDEIEVALYQHPEIEEAAVVSTVDAEGGTRIKAFISPRGSHKLSQIEMKRYCSEVLPLYMVPDLIRFTQSLPRTSTNKVDYQKLKEIV